MFETEFQDKKANGEDYLQEDDSEILYFTYLIQSSDWEYIFADDINEIIDRYAMHKQGIFSFGNIYDELPNWWVDALHLLNGEEHKAANARRHIDGSKTG